MDSEEAKVVDLHNRSSNARYDRLRRLRRYQALLAARPATRPAPADVVNDPMTAVDVDALEKLREAAKPGPWRVAANGEDVVSPTQGVVADAYNTADAALIVAAVNALPELLAEVRRGRALREAVNGLARKYDQPAEPGPWAEGARSLYGGGQVAYDLLAVLAATDD